MLRKIFTILRGNKVLFFIITLAFLLRILGISHSLPFVFHPDEATVVRSALAVRFNPNPGHFDWPHLYIYANYFVYMAFAVLRKAFEFVGLGSSLPILWDDNVIFYLITRILTATVSALTCLVIYKTARKLFDHQVGLLSALVFAVLPFHVRHSHYSLVDVPMLFLLTMSLYFCVLILKTKNVRYYILAGLFAGLGASTKYNGGLIALTVLIAHILRIISSKNEKFFRLENMLRLCYSGIFAVVGFIIGTPYALLDFKTFLRTDNSNGALWQFTNVGSSTFLEHLQKLPSVLFVKLPDDFGYTFFYVFLVSAALTLFATFMHYQSRSIKFEQRFKMLFLTVPALIYIFYISSFDRARSHYFFVIYPFVAICAAYIISLVLQKVSTKKIYTFFVYLGFFGLPILLSVRQSITFIRNDTRYVLYERLLSNSDLPVLSDDRDIRMVLEKFPTYKNSRNSDLYGLGGLYITTDADAKVKKLEKDNVIKSKQIISNNLRLGPTLFIYEFK